MSDYPLIPAHVIAYWRKRWGWSEQDVREHYERYKDDVLHREGKLDDWTPISACCHPEHRHYARGMCRSCYDKWYRAKGKELIAKDDTHESNANLTTT